MIKPLIWRERFKDLVPNHFSASPLRLVLLSFGLSPTHRHRHRPPQVLHNKDIGKDVELKKHLVPTPSGASKFDFSLVRSSSTLKPMVAPWHL